jgi:pimeloyl-ACP methyl ester carboxylesterase
MEFFAISNGIPVHISDSKKGDKTILLLHGYLETLYIFEEFADALQKEGYRVIMLDLPGHGLSGSNKEINTMEFCAGVVADVLKKNNIEKAWVAGHSMGGYIAQNCIKHYPDLFEGVILLNSTPFADSPEKRTDREREIELIRKSKLGNLAALSIPRMYAPANLRKFDEKIEETVEISETHDPNGIVACIKGMMQREETKDVLAKTEKAMFIFGTEDKFITEEIREKLIGEFPNVKAVVIPETGHNSFIEEPQKVLEAIENFIG